ncbi:GNAT family N-acetyltransferase [Ornithinimicrobium sp. W1679]|uniref:GNAT family N-acetyltransferase n=1 Tax=Ornithinimicrobium sp. W1679 TaxID=3418770 RepID=UPI003CF9D8D5
MTNVAVVHRPAESRWEAMSGEDVVGHLSYDTIGNTVDLHHTLVDPAHRNKGIADKLVEEAVREIRAEKMSVRPTCSYVRAWMDQHPEHQDLLEPSLLPEDQDVVEESSGDQDAAGEGASGGRSPSDPAP